MEVLSKSVSLFLMVYTVLIVEQVYAAEEIYGLMVTPIRIGQYVKLHVWWNSTLPGEANYAVSVEHINTDKCVLKESPFQNQKHIKCAPIWFGTEETNIVIPSNTDSVAKHTCSIQQLCTYSVQIETVNYSTHKIKQTVTVPDCVQGLCSCHYSELLPALINTSADINVTSNELIVKWQISSYNSTDLPKDVTPKFVYISVRRGTNNELGWGGQHSSMKELMLPVESGSHRFDIDEFAGNKFIFVVQLKVIDTRECERAAGPLRVTLPNPDTKSNSSRYFKATCTSDAACECERLNNFPDFLVAARYEGDQIIVTWRSLKSITWPGTLPSGKIGLELSIRSESTGTILCTVTVDPATTNTHTFVVSEFESDQISSVLLASSFVDNNNHCERRMPEYKLQSHPPKAIALPLIIILMIGFVAIVVTCSLFAYFKRRSNIRWKANNWREVYVRSSGDHHQQVAMEENRLYIDMDILNARARGDADYLEIPHSCLRIGREIGKGAFGRVFMASAVKLPGFSGPKIVAIKQLKKCSSSDEFDEFLDEITMMKKVGKHPNIVALLGCCTIKEPLTMIMEYVGCGDLLEYLRKIRAKHLAKAHQLELGSQVENVSSVQNSGTANNLFSPMVKYLDLLHTSSSNSDASYITQTDTATRPSMTETTYTILSGAMVPGEDNASTLGSCSLEYVLDHKELHNFAKQIACGMERLEELQITHRDLAARNILIDERKTLKISDFGLSRTGIYVNTRNKKVPLRWLSIEAMRDNLYSNKSDVWAFGIVLWEIGTLGGYPYPSVSNHELFAYLQEGKRLERPENCTTDVYDLMLQCWKDDPNERPSFQQISNSLQPHKKIYIDFNEIEPTYVFPPTSEQIRLAVANNK